MLRVKRNWGYLGRSCLIYSVIASTSVFAALFLLPAGQLSAELKAPRAKDRQVTLVVTSLLKDEHLSQHELDDEISQRCMTSFLDMLDRMKVYFYESDIAEFRAFERQLDDAASRGDITFAYRVFQRFVQRVDERVAMVQQLLDEPVDFTLREEMITDPDELSFPKDEREAKDRWRKRIKYDLLMLKVDDKVGDEARQKLKRRYQSFARRMHQTDADELLEMYLTSLTTGYDPHTTYMSPSTLENFEIIMSLELEGIGAALKSEDGFTVVTKIIPGGAADKEGTLKEEDQIVSVGEGIDGEMLDIVDMKLTDVVHKIRGKAGTVVRLGVMPAKGTETKVVKITRAKIELTDSEAQGLIFEEGRRPDGKPFKIGVVNLPSFYMDMEAARKGIPDFKSTTRDVRKILKEFSEEGVDAVIVDLRRNGGGSLTEAISLTGLFIDRGPVVQVKGPDGRVHQYDDVKGGMAWGGPLVVVTSKMSASASEIFAGAIQDYCRGILVGDVSTHGKGTVQSLMNLGRQLFRFIPNRPNLGALKITMQQFYRPSGESTQKRGVLADVVLPSLTTHMDIGEEDLDFAIDFERVPAVRYDLYDLVNKGALEDLRGRSSARQNQSEDFVELVEDIDLYREHKDRKRVSLNEKQFFERRAELNAEEEEKKTFEEGEKEDDVFPRDFYNNEILAITLDYLNILKGNRIARILR